MRLKVLAAMRFRITCRFSLRHPLLVIKLALVSSLIPLPHFHGSHCPPHHSGAIPYVGHSFSVNNEWKGINRQEWTQNSYFSVLYLYSQEFGLHSIAVSHRKAPPHT